MSFLIMYVTHPSKDVAKSIVDKLLHERLIACANLLPMESMYWWQGKISKDDEYVTILKTKIELKNRVEQRLAEIHPYDVPCIVSWEVSANKEYEDWIDAETQ